MNAHTFIIGTDTVECRSYKVVGIGHGFAPWPWLAYRTGGAAGHRCMVAWPDTATGTKSWSISFINTHAIKSFQVSIFSIKTQIVSVCMSRKLSEVWLFNLWSEIGQLNWRNPHGDRDAIHVFSTFTRGLCSYNVRFFNDNITAVELSYWRKRESQTTHGPVVVILRFLAWLY